MSKKGLVLVVDDEKDLVEILQSEVELLGFDSISAGNGKEAVDLVLSYHQQKKWIDAIVSDINMPLKNGLDFLRDIRAAGVQSPFIFFSAYGDKEKTLEALRLGAMDFVEKPFDPDLLGQTITRAVELGQMMKSIEDELDRLLENSNLPAEEIENFKKAQREVLKFKKTQ